MIQQGQVFKLKTKGTDGQPLWAYRYPLEGRSSERPQVGGFATRAEAEKALRKVLDRLGPGGGRATITLADFVAEYLQMHQAAPVTIAKLRWLLSKATDVLEKRLSDLSPRASGRPGRSTRLQALTRDRGGAWTLGGRRASFLSPHQTTKGADEQR
jgi:hypothetical protein